jgi:hypothetical protein
VVDIKSNQGGGNCPPCPIPGTGFVPNEPTFMSTNATATVTIEFRDLQALCGGNLPRLVSVMDAQGNFIRVRCGQGQMVQGNFPNSVVFCLFDEAINTEQGNPDNFFNQQNFTVRIVCPGTTDTLTVSSTTCVLPVRFKSFNANRRNNNVAVIWETASETNNKGFNVQRNGGGGWETVAFVNSKADGGNSNSILSYSFNDVNTSRGVTQYRVQQVDIDGKSSYSDIRAVRGEGLGSNLLVYPNPSNNGNVNVVFEDQNSTRDVLVRDISGRLVKQYKDVTNNMLVIDNLVNGVYSIQVTDRTTSKSVFEKLIVRRN